MKLMEEEGVEFKVSVNIGKDVSVKSLMNEHDAMLLCIGSTWPRDLPIKGRSAEGIYYAMSFLETWQKKQVYDEPLADLKLFAKGKDVVVIGGGDTGVDCIATALSQVSPPRL